MLLPPPDLNSYRRAVVQAQRGTVHYHTHTHTHYPHCVCLSSGHLCQVGHRTEPARCGGAEACEAGMHHSESVYVKPSRPSQRTRHGHSKGRKQDYLIRHSAEIFQQIHTSTVVHAVRECVVMALFSLLSHRGLSN